MYHDDEAKNIQMAIDHFEWVLEKSKEREELVNASNFKTQALWWRHASGANRLFTENEDFPLKTWAKRVATAYNEDPTAMCYYAMSNYWIKGWGTEKLVWLDLAWFLLRSKHQSPPPGFHQVYFQYTYACSSSGHRHNTWQLKDLSFLISALEHMAVFAATFSFKEAYMLQRYVLFPIMETSVTYPLGPKDVPCRLLKIWTN
jgi:hypothetical protein